jgi:uncharacterized membrane protein YoaK (UPF0700 family)
MLRRRKDERTLKENLMLASSTAFVSGSTNVIGVVAFLTTTANVTGHVAHFAKNIVQSNYHGIYIFGIWSLMFITGAFVSNFLLNALDGKSQYRAHAAPIYIEIVLLFLVAFYGDVLYRETQLEREIVVGVLLFSIGLQNSLVSNVSGGLIKSSHLTGLFTDLGSELAERIFIKDPRKAKPLNNKLYVRFTILGFYILGGVVGGYFFDQYDLAIFYVVPFILITIIYYDLSPLALHTLSQLFNRPEKSIIQKS